MANLFDDIIPDPEERNPFDDIIPEPQNQGIVSRQSLQQFLPAPVNVLANTIFGTPEPTDPEKRFAQGILEGATGLTSQGLEAPNPPGFDAGDVSSVIGNVLGVGAGFIPFVRGAQALKIGVPAAKATLSQLSKAGGKRVATEFGGFEAFRELAQTVTGQQTDKPLVSAAKVGGSAALGGAFGFLTPRVLNLIKASGGRLSDFIKATSVAVRNKRAVEDALQEGIKASGVKDGPKVFRRIMQDFIATEQKAKPGPQVFEEVMGVKIPEPLLKGDKSLPDTLVQKRLEDRTQALFQVPASKTRPETLPSLKRDITTQDVEGIAKGLEPLPEGKLTHINLNTFNTIDEGKSLIGKLADDLVQKGQPLRAGDVKRFAEGILGLPEKQFQKNVAMQGLTPERVVAASSGFQSVIDETSQKIVRFKNGELGMEQLLDDVIKFGNAQIGYGGVSAEGGRILNAFKLQNKTMKAKQFVLNSLVKDLGGKKNAEEMFKRAGEILEKTDDPLVMTQLMKDLIEVPTFRDKAFEVWINLILSGPITQARNIVGNSLGFVSKAVVERPLAATTELAKHALTGGKLPRQRFFGEAFSPNQLYAFLQGNIEGVRAGIKAFQTEQAQFGRSRLDIPGKPFQRVFKPALKGKAQVLALGRGPTRALLFFDEFAKAVNYRTDVAARAYRQASLEGLTGDAFSQRLAELSKNPTEIIDQAAVTEAIYRTFQTELGTLGKQALAFRKSAPGLEYFAPFMRTPINLLKFSFDFTPINLMMKLAKANKQDLASGVFSEEISKPLAGTMISIALYQMAKTQNSEGKQYITGGGPSSPAEFRVWRSAGNQPYSIQIPGKAPIQYGMMQPFGTNVALVADIAELGFLVEPEDAVQKILSSITNNITNQTYMQQVGNLLAIFTDPHKAEFEGEKLLTTFAGSFIPNFIAQATRVFDPLVRTTKTGEGFTQQIVNQLKSRTPGLRQDLYPLRNIFGKPIVNRNFGPENLLNPFNRAEIVNDPLINEVERLGITGGMGSPRRTLIEKGIKIRLTDPQYDKYVELAGQLSEQEAQRVFTSPIYRELSDERKFFFLQRAIKKGRQNAIDIMKDELRSTF